MQGRGMRAFAYRAGFAERFPHGRVLPSYIYDDEVENMTIVYRPRGVCAVRMEVSVEEGIVRHVAIEGGCDGNHKGLISLLDGMPAEEAVRRMRGIRCGMRPTSCPDQLANAIEACLNEERKA